MADTHNDDTGWTAFFTYLIWRADKIVPDTTRLQEAERLVFYQIYREELDLYWQDVFGREYIGLPRDWSEWYAYYDQSANAIRESGLPFARTLYQPQVRERGRKLANPGDTTAIEPQQATPPPTSSQMSVEPPTSLTNPDGGEHHEPVKPDESTDQWP
jgi:hypothetical protein